jgi:hypothetical protein
VKNDLFDIREYTITFYTEDRVCPEDVSASENRQTPVTPHDVAIYGVERMLVCAEHFSVDVTDDAGVAHKFAVYRWDGEWVCERRGEDRQATKGGEDCSGGDL